MPKKGHLKLYKQFSAELGARIQKARMAKGMTQDELAERSSVNRATIGMLETGRQGLDTLNLVLLAHALGVHPSRLLPKVNFTTLK